MYLYMYFFIYKKYFFFLFFLRRSFNVSLPLQCMSTVESLQIVFEIAFNKKYFITLICFKYNIDGLYFFLPYFYILIHYSLLENLPNVKYKINWSSVAVDTNKSYTKTWFRENSFLFLSRYQKLLFNKFKSCGSHKLIWTENKPFSYFTIYRIFKRIAQTFGTRKSVELCRCGLYVGFKIKRLKK